MSKESANGKTDRVITGLHRAENLTGSNLHKRNDLLKWYRKKGFLTQAQQGLAAGLVRDSIRLSGKESGDSDKFFLYAISNGETVKLGFSKDPRRRLNNLQSGSPKKVWIIWEYYVGRIEEVARRQERKLHRYCSSYRIRGEWFSISCLDMVREFHVRQEAMKPKTNESNICTKD